MKIGNVTKHSVIQLRIDWANECCFHLLTLNIEKHTKKFVFEIGLFGITFLLMVDFSKDLIKEITNIQSQNK